jgi:predicted amidohydrolase
MLAQDRTIVGLAGIDRDRRNTTYIATGGTLHKQAKLSLSSEDDEMHVKGGQDLRIFLPPENHNHDALRWATLNCHDYTHVDLLRLIQESRIELLIVVTYNTATRLFWQYAMADMHRLFCYVVVANVAELGGSAVFAPYRRIGRDANAQFSAGGQVFGSRGPGEFRVTIPIDVMGLRGLRSEFTRHGFQAKAVQRSRHSVYEPIAPPEHYMATFDRPAGPPKLEGVLDVPVEWNFDHPRVAVAQLHHMGIQAYIDTKYRIRHHKSCGSFEHLLSMRLLELETRCRHQGLTKSGTLLDLLVFPEVFVPRSFIGSLQGYSDRIGTIIVAGLDYPEGGEDQNANECMIIQPNKAPAYYRKITRSQYDARRDNSGDLMPMQRGRHLLRFVNSRGRGFGVLICYDFSHLDLVWHLNLSRRDYPLDLTVVVAHNPFSELYRACCVADSHRFYQYVVMCNVAEYGGSGVFGPVRTPGTRQVLLDAGKGVETVALAELNLKELHESRQTSDNNLHTGDYMRRPGVFQGRCS